MGGRGASSSAGTKTIQGRPVVTSATGYQIWNIGRNAPKGYVPLIKGRGENAQTAYIKHPLADDLAKSGHYASNAVNYQRVETAERELSKARNNLERMNKNDVAQNAPERLRVTRKIKELEIAIRIRRSLGI